MEIQKRIRHADLFLFIIYFIHLNDIIPSEFMHFEISIFVFISFGFVFSCTYQLFRTTTKKKLNLINIVYLQLISICIFVFVMIDKRKYVTWDKQTI